MNDRDSRSDSNQNWPDKPKCTCGNENLIFIEKDGFIKIKCPKCGRSMKFRK